MNSEKVKCLSFVTKNEKKAENKLRIYLTCSELDKDRYFERICRDIFAITDCAIYYTGNMDADYDEQIIQSDLHQMNLFVVIVTYEMMKSDCRAARQDIPFAINNGIPILPIMMDDAVDIYKEKIGDIQYLRCDKFDETALSYENKLKKYLSSVIIDDDTRRKIQAAFDAYIFLSYRKRDRIYANELMKLIHNAPEFRSTAIWYDEYLVPGEHFNDAIRLAIEKSSLFTLVVTPNLLEDGNYVLTKEYPYAMELDSIGIIPVEMVETDEYALKNKYIGIPRCIIGKDNEEFREVFLKSLHNVAVRADEDNPVHSYMLGLAYLEGIDVEINREYAFEYINQAASAEQPVLEALDKLAQLYHDGIGVDRNWDMWLTTLEKCVKLSGQYADIDEERLIERKGVLADAYNELGRYQESLEYLKEIYQYLLDSRGEDDDETMKILGKMSIAYQNLGDISKARDINERLLNKQKSLNGESHVNTLLTMDRLAKNLFYMGEYDSAFDILRRANQGLRELLGDDNPTAIEVRLHFFDIQFWTGHYAYAGDMFWAIYGTMKEKYGDDHPDTIMTKAKSWICVAMDEDDAIKGLHHGGEGIRELERVLGDNHPKVIELKYYCNILQCTINPLGGGLEGLENVYELRKKIYGGKHPETTQVLQTIEKIKANPLKFKTYGFSMVDE